MLQTRPAKQIIFIATLLIVVIFLGRSLSPFQNEMFTGHDETQAARIQQFHFNIQLGKFPPRIAPDFSFRLGYPVFNYYAPLPYWIASDMQSLGLDIFSAMKLTYLLALIVGFVGMFFLCRYYFAYYPALLGSFFYVSSPFVAVDIFVRANMGEVWVFALLPWGLYTLLKNSKRNIIWTGLVLSFLFTSHNILSLVSLGIVGIFAFFTEKRYLNFGTIGLGLLLGGYFLFPAILELPFVQAASIAKVTDYQDHFLCLTQLWSSPWGYAGSARGCTADGMSFMIGKLTILMGVSGLVLLAYTIYNRRHHTFLRLVETIAENIIEKINKIYSLITHESIRNTRIRQSQILFFATVTIVSLFLTLPISQFIWKVFEPIFSLFQFPWRFLIFVLFGLSFFSALSVTFISKKAQLFVVLTIIVVAFSINQKYFYGNNLSYIAFTDKYLSKTYLTQKVAYKVPEYVPKNVKYEAWKALEKNPKAIDTSTPVAPMKNSEVLVLEDTPFKKLFTARAPSAIIANIHYAPYWKILVDYKLYTPTRFDQLGRPYIEVSDTSYTSVQIEYNQTVLELISTMISILTLGALTVWSIKQYKPAWNNIPIKKT